MRPTTFAPGVSPLPTVDGLLTSPLAADCLHDLPRPAHWERVVRTVASYADDIVAEWEDWHADGRTVIPLRLIDELHVALLDRAVAFLEQRLADDIAEDEGQGCVP